MSSDYDVYMLGLQNAKERTIEDFSTMFKEVDPRFKLTGVNQPDKSFLAIVEITWDG